MRIDGTLTRAAAQAAPASKTAGQGDFLQALQESISQVNDLQGQADTLVAQVAAGDLESVHQAMVALEKASLAMDLTIQVRNKVIEAYQELMRTQV